jgi:hypothetical protein
MAVRELALWLLMLGLVLLALPVVPLALAVVWGERKKPAAVSVWVVHWMALGSALYGLRPWQDWVSGPPALFVWLLWCGLLGAELLGAAVLAVVKPGLFRWLALIELGLLIFVGLSYVAVQGILASS